MSRLPAVRSRPSGDDRRELLDGCRARAVPARRGADLRYAPGRAGCDASTSATDGIVDWAMRPSSPFDPAQIALEKLTISDGQVRIHHAASGRDPCAGQDQGERLGELPGRSVAGRRLAAAGRHGDRDRGVDRQGRRAAGMRLRLRLDPNRRSIRRRSRATARFASTPAQLAYAAPSGWCRGAGDAKAARPPRPECRGDRRAGVRPAAGPGRVSGQFRSRSQAASSSAVPLRDRPVRTIPTPPTAAPARSRRRAALCGEATGRAGALRRGGRRRQGPGRDLADRLGALQPSWRRCRRPDHCRADRRRPAGSRGRRHHDPRRQAEAEPAADGWAVRSLRRRCPAAPRWRRRAPCRSRAIPASTAICFWRSASRPASPPGCRRTSTRRSAACRPPVSRRKVPALRRRQHFSELELILGKAKFHGEIDRRQPPDGRPSMRIKLAGDALDVEGPAPSPRCSSTTRA